MAHVDGVMLGRAAYADPYMMAGVDPVLFGEQGGALSRIEVLDSLVPYVESQLAEGARLQPMMRHILGLFHGQPRARAFRRYLAEHAHRHGAGIEVLLRARAIVAEDVRQAIAAE